MKFITVRDLRGRPGEVWSKLARDKDLVLTSNGKPIAILSAVSEETLEGSLAALRQTRAVTAAEAMQSESIAAGTDKMTLGEINAEIAAARKARRR
jgi:antitoxin (DNA-binding transcriptional repressor) of toxin-antitoxin stability system